MLVGALFGALHTSGGRNWQFATWAGALGTVYGLAYVWTYDLAVPVLAHSLGNVAAAYFWLRARDEQARSDTSDTPQKQ